MRANGARGGPLRLVFALVAAAGALLRAEAAGDGRLQLSYTGVLLEPNGGRAYELPTLPFAYSELEPYIDEATVRVHHDGHQRAYTDNMNALLAQWRAQDETGLSNRSLVEIFANAHAVPAAFRQKLINQGGGFVNHLLYWFTLSSNTNTERRLPSSVLMGEIEDAFGSFDAFVAAFNSSALSLFGSGYVWLVRNQNAELEIVATANQELTFQRSVCPAPAGRYCTPLLTIDVWEHAYYLKNQNRRAKYVSAWWQLVDWTGVERLDAAFAQTRVKAWKTSRDRADNALE